MSKPSTYEVLCATCDEPVAWCDGKYGDWMHATTRREIADDGHIAEPQSPAQTIRAMKRTPTRRTPERILAARRRAAHRRTAAVMRDAGATFREIADALGVCEETARLYVHPPRKVHVA